MARPPREDTRTPEQAQADEIEEKEQGQEARPSGVLQVVTIEIRQLTPFPESLPRCTAKTRDGMQCMFSARYLQNGQPCCGAHLGRPSTVFVRSKRPW